MSSYPIFIHGVCNNKYVRNETYNKKMQLFSKQCYIKHSQFFGLALSKESKIVDVLKQKYLCCPICNDSIHDRFIWNKFINDNYIQECFIDHEKYYVYLVRNDKDTSNCKCQYCKESIKVDIIEEDMLKKINPGEERITNNIINKYCN